MVFFCPVMGRGSLTIPVFCGIRSWPGSEPRPASSQENRFGLSGLSFLLAPLGGETRCRETVAELGMANLAVTRGFDHGPGLGIGKQRLEHQRVQAMAAAIGAEGAEDGRAGESKIADRIERLVPHEFVGEAKTFAIDDAVVADGNRIVERSAESKPSSPEPLHVLHEAEGPGAGDFAAEGTRVQVDLDALIADQRGIEIDGDIEMETVMRGELAIGASIFHRDLLQNFEVAAGSFELGQAHLVDRLDKARGATVHDRNFGAVDLDQSVVDTEPAQRGHQMLDGGNRGAVAVANHGAQGNARDRALIGCDLGLVAVAIGKKETNAGVAVGGTKSDGDWRSAMHSGAGKRDFAGKRRLACPDKAPHPPRPPSRILSSLLARGLPSDPPIDLRSSALLAGLLSVLAVCRFGSAISICEEP